MTSSSWDAEESATGSVNISSSTLELVYNGGNQTVGLRWAGLTIPKGAIITAAYIQFYSSSAQSGAAALTFQAQAADNPATFTTATRNISSRPLTASAIAWSPAAWASGESNLNERTPDLSAAIQEVVGRTGWASGNALAIIVTGTGVRAATSYNGTRSRAPLLHVEYQMFDAPPVANLSVTQLATPALTVNASGSASTDTDQTPIATYGFDFGDGSPVVTTTAPISGAQHTYAAAGTYTVTLTATDTGNNTSAPVTGSIAVQPDLAPVANLSVTQLATPALTVNASGSSSTDTDLTPIAGYHFDFGDGTPVVTTTAPTASAQHTYAAVGTYTVALTVTDTGNNTSGPVTAPITVNPPPDNPPVASLSVTQIATPAFTVNADGSSSTDTDLTPIATYQFDFGDGSGVVTTTAPTSSAQHTYAAAGSYTVTLTAIDTGNNPSATVSTSVNVQADAAPAAQLAVTQLVSPPLTVSASGSGSTDTDATPIASYQFDFGDGSAIVNTTAPMLSTTHTYAAAGTYTVTLTATDAGGNVSAPVTASITLSVALTPAIAERRISASTDDAEESASASMYLNSSDLELVYDGSIQKVGVRFLGVAVPPGATITNAWVQFTVDEAQSEATSLLIQGQAIDNAPTFLSSSSNISGRTRTIASVPWDPVAWSTIGQAGGDQRTPSLAAVIQELVNRPGWSSGNALALVITGTGHRTAVAYDGNSSKAALLHIEYQASLGANLAPVVSAGSDKSITLPSGVSLAGTVTDDGLPSPPAAVTCSWSTTSGPGQAAFVNAVSPSTTATFPVKGTYVLRLTCSDSLLQAFDEASITVGSAVSLVVEKRVAASSDDAEESSSGSLGLSSGDLELVYDSSIQKVGVRFPGVAVPQGATITNAWVQFTVDEAQSETTSLLIQGQAIDNAPTFLSSSSNISGRTRTNASVPWNPVAWSTIGQAGANQRTPSLAAVIQEIVNRPGWSSGNALAFVITGTGHRTAVAYDGSSSAAPLLHIEYQGTPGVNAAPVVSAGSDKSTTLPSGVSLAGTATDDGLPSPPAVVTCGWSTTSGPGQAVFANAASPSTTATFPASGTYVLRLTCSDSLLQKFDEASITVNSASSSSSSIAVYAGYYDTHHSSNLRPRPSPWSGSSGVVFDGNPDTSSGGWDTSTIRVDNLTGSTLSVVVTVDIGSNHFSLWGSNSIPAGGKLIVAQTSMENFDGSDLNSAGCYSCSSSLCATAVSSTIPVVHVTAGGQTYNISDLGQILNTHGVDSAGCPYTGTRNDESQNWIQIK